LSASQNIATQWYPILRMTDFVNKYFDYPDIYADSTGFGLYVNQTCYNYPHLDILTTDMSRLLIWSYDICFKEIVYKHSDNSDKAKSILYDLNRELHEICRAIMDMENDERASLVFPDSPKAEIIRAEIFDLEEKYIEKTESMFK
jgi:hypothetical protein